MEKRGKEPFLQNAIAKILQKSKKPMRVSELAQKIDRANPCTYQTLQAMIKKGLVQKVAGAHSRDVAYELK